MLTFLRRHLLFIIFAILIALQAAMLFEMSQLRETIDRYRCGTRTIPCKVVVIPDH